MPRIDETRPFIAVRIAVLTVSDTRTIKEDKSGDLLAEMIKESGHEVVDRAVVKDDVAQIRARVQGWVADPQIDVVITTGGTGFTGRDVTPEAVKPLFEKEIDGFSTVFHMISFKSVETS
ncbi:MAG TPA: molybdenum cofactor synthesis domain-containing protein, partial [Hyphomicrobiaceae bacterium]|nr:molybdenum cofactor synthesis domain-containing protein [Hyphomicrobiaceae bacterium]